MYVHLTTSLLILTLALAVLTLCACTPPLNQVLQLWDFLLAFGVHLNILCVIAQLLLIRDEVMKSSRFVTTYRLEYDHNRSCTVRCVSFVRFQTWRLCLLSVLR